IIGSTGSSKTTLVQLLPRLYDVTEGEVLVGGHDVREYRLDNLRKSVSMVLQKNVLFSGSIEENLKWGDQNATHEEVVEAARCAQADDFITSFPKGYETDLGQGGVNVSGGQKQRLCIARALLKKPDIIIMDDSTSAVDTETDKKIRTALRERLAGMTTIIIAQRISSIMDADKIVVMNEGKIEDIGTHDELMGRNMVYHDLYETQLKGVSQ
ncbi:MAG: ATP-binding cassette domain-containing protein, partial [Erysipelotrichaceae bacterium]|nr:ATP-binding cassette domain-containing protein [Erysipelotrichaceae bacterium]